MEQSRITVQGIGKSVGKPDVANFEVAMESRGFSTATVREDIKEMLRSALELLEEHVVTERTQVMPPVVRTEVSYGKESNLPQEKVCTSIIKAEMHGLDSFESLVSTLNQIGCEVENVTLGVSDRTDLEEAARKQAFEDAQNKALFYAKQCKLKLSKVLSLVEEEQFCVDGQTHMLSRHESGVFEEGQYEVSTTVNVCFLCETSEFSKKGTL